MINFLFAAKKTIRRQIQAKKRQKSTWWFITYMGSVLMKLK